MQAQALLAQLQDRETTITELKRLVSTLEQDNSQQRDAIALQTSKVELLTQFSSRL